MRTPRTGSRDSSPPDLGAEGRRFGERSGDKLDPKGRLIVALDVDSPERAAALVEELRDEVGLFKVGKQLFVRSGPQIVRAIRERGGEVFLDLKFHDIPRTVANASIEATRLGVKMFDVHASGSLVMMRRAVQAVNRTCRTEGLSRPLILGVTVLTSLSVEDLRMVGVRAGIRSQVVRLASLAKEAGMDGVVSSPLEAARIRKACGAGFKIVTPGVRLAGADWDDQKRVMTPGGAIEAGADYIVVGRTITAASDPRDAARRVVGEIAVALA